MSLLTICDLDSNNTVCAKAILSMMDFPIVMDSATWCKLIDVWAQEYGADSFTVTDGGRFIETVSPGRRAQYAAEMRRRQALPYNGQWYKVELILSSTS